MIYEKSCGAVVFTVVNNEILYLLVRNLEGIYGFPKGHVENNEKETETALREVKEEVDINVVLIDGFRLIDEYPIPQKENTMKQVVYFLGKYFNQQHKYQKEELSDAVLVNYEKALSLFQFESNKIILSKAHKYLLKEMK